MAGGFGSDLLVDCLSCQTDDLEFDSGLGLAPALALEGLLDCGLGELLGVALPVTRGNGLSGLSLVV